MKIYKEKQFLIFDFEDGKTVKYNFASKEAIGKKGKPVKNLCSQLRGLNIDQLYECCVDKQYGKFLKFVKRNESCDYEISNIGTILDRVPYYSKFEQIFSAGIEDIIDNRNFSHSINDIPKALIKLCKTHSIKLSDKFLECYKTNPDGYQLAYKLEYISLTDEDIYKVLSHRSSVKKFYGTRYYDYEYVYFSTFNNLIEEYGYTAKGLMNYIDYLKTYEAIEDVEFVMRELYDYANMMKQISNKFDKYPRHFLTTHKIACRNYNRLKQEFDEEKFKNRIDKSMEKTFGDYRFIYPNCTQDIKDESVQMSNCVSSYVDKVIDGRCHILFLRHKDNLDKSLVTIEVRNGAIVQALQRYNHPLTSEQKVIVEKWNTWYANKNKKENESEELECQLRKAI